MYRRVMGEAFDDPDRIVVIDDTGFAKKGRHWWVWHASTPARWAKPTTARSPCRCTMPLPRGTIHWRCACFCQTPGPASLSEWRPRGYQSSTRRLAPRMRSHWTCWINSIPKGCRIGLWWLTPATALASTFVADSMSAECSTLLASPATKRC
jgi:hypothetical protein